MSIKLTMAISQLKSMPFDDTGEITSGDISQLLHVVDALRSVLFSRAVTLDKLIYHLSHAFVLTRQGRSLQSNALIADFFLLSLRDFLCKYLSTIAELSPEKKHIIYRVKSRLSCAVHFNYELTEIALADERRNRDQEALSAMTNKAGATEFAIDAIRLIDAPSIPNVCTKRVSFLQNASSCHLSSQIKDNTRVITIESFRPTFALYTVVNLNTRFDTAIHSGMESIRHFNDNGYLSEDTDDKNEGHRRKKRARDKSHATIAGDKGDHLFFQKSIYQPPDRKSWYALCMADNERSPPSSFWPKQIVLQNSRDIMNDSAIRELMDRLDKVEINLGEKNHPEHQLALENRENEDIINHDNDEPYCRRGRANLAASSFDRRGVASPAPGRYLKSPSYGDKTSLFTKPHLYTADVESYIKEQQRQYNSSQSSSSGSLIDLKHPHLALLHRFSINWAKLHFMEPRVFTRGGNIQV